MATTPLPPPPLLRSNTIHPYNYRSRIQLPYRFPCSPLPVLHRRPVESTHLLRLNAVQIGSPVREKEELESTSSDFSVLLEVSGMMCGACAARVKTVLSSDDRVESAAVNLLTETAAVRLNRSSSSSSPLAVVEDLATRLTECGFPSKRRSKGVGSVREDVKKWKEMISRKEELLVKSRSRVLFAWTLVALCCGSHVSHLLHPLGIHLHGPFWDMLHDPYVKCATAMLAFLGPGREILLDGFRAFVKGSPNMNSLVGFGSIAAFCISAVSLLNPEFGWNTSFFDEPVMLLGFVLLGRSLEEKARLQASSDMNELLSLVSSQSRLVVASESNSSTDSVISTDTITFEVPTDEVRVGDAVLVLPGETIPIDGMVLAGRSFVDESMLTGESLPVLKERGYSVSSGTINWDGPLRIEASTTGATTTISKIIRMVEDAQGQEAPIQRLADSIAGPFVFSVMTLSAATFAFWYCIGTNIFPDVLLNDIAGPNGNSFLLSLKLSVNVLVVSCPCALGLATPTAILVGTSLGARRGLLIRGGDILERLARINLVALDKTGTLTEGKPAVTSVISLLHVDTEIIRLAAAVEKMASHPIARAIVNKAENLQLKIPPTKGQLSEPGFGSLAEVDGLLVAVGKLEWVYGLFKEKMKESDLRSLEAHVALSSSQDISELNQSKSVVYVGCEGEGIIGAIVISDVLREDAEFTVSRLQDKGITTVLLSGDREEAVSTVGKIVGISEGNIRPSLTPEQKANIVSNFKAEGHHVAMVGDGVNDAPSLALADVGVALQIESKDNAASDAASVVLLGNKLSQLLEAVDLAKATISKVHQNLAWAVAYNVISIPIAAGVLLPNYDFAMTPSLSGGLMALSSIFVVTNSLLLRIDGGGGPTRRPQPPSPKKP